MCDDHECAQRERSPARRWMMHLGLEWLFRFFQEPTRLWRRYLINNPLFVVRAAGQMLSLRK